MKTGEAVDIGVAAFTNSLNLSSNSFYSFDLAGFNFIVSGIIFLDTLIPFMISFFSNKESK